MKKLALLTSGGDAPGMNATVRSVVRVALARDLEVTGIRHGYRGLLQGDFMPLGLRDVSNIIQRGGTILKTSRSEEFLTSDGIQMAGGVLDLHGIEGLVVIGGDGTFRGGAALEKVWTGRVVGVPGTIDNDLWGTDFTIGFDTAVNTALDAIDKIRDTADAHERFFLVEVMGRNSGFIALEVGIGSGAEEIVMPEQMFNAKEICSRLCDARERGKTSCILVVAEGNETGGAIKVAEELRRLSQIEYRVVILGHLQRGGNPTARDRVLATKLGAYAVDLLQQGANGVMAGEVKGQLRATHFPDTWKNKKPLDPFLLKIHPLVSL